MPNLTGNSLYKIDRFLTSWAAGICSGSVECRLFKSSLLWEANPFAFQKNLNYMLRSPDINVIMNDLIVIFVWYIRLFDVMIILSRAFR